MDNEYNRKFLTDMFNPQTKFEHGMTLTFIRGFLMGLFSTMEYDLSLFLAYSLKEKPYTKRYFRDEIKLLKKFLSENHKEFLLENPEFANKINRFHKLRIKMAHWNIQVPNSNDYSKIDYFIIIKTDDILKEPVSYERYNISTFKSDIKELKEIINSLVLLIGLAKTGAY